MGGYMKMVFTSFFGKLFTTYIAEEIIVFTVILVFSVVLFSIVGIILIHTISKRNKEIVNPILLLDNLTGCKTSEMFVRDFKNKPAFLLVMDLNNLSQIKDLYGIEYSNIILEEVSSKLLSLFGVGNCYRIGFDEFIVNTKFKITSEQLREKLEFLTHEFAVSNGRKVMLDVTLGYKTKKYHDIETHDTKDIKKFKEVKPRAEVVIGKNKEKEQVRR